MNEKLLKSMNEQINKEFYSAYLYLSMAQDLEEKNMPGMSKWMHEQFREEQFHAFKQIKFLNSRGARVELKEIEKPKLTWDSVIEIFEDTKIHESEVTLAINELTALAVELEDFATVNFLQWYIKEQVEEEENVAKIVAEIKLIGDNGYGLLMMDRELGTRLFVEPVKE